MGSLTKAIQGFVLFFTGMIVMYAGWDLIAEFINLFSTNDLMHAIAWIGTILIFVLMTIVVPFSMIISGMKDADK